MGCSDGPKRKSVYVTNIIPPAPIFQTTIVTKANNGLMSKSIYLNGSGLPHSDGSACSMSNGTAQVVSVSSLGQFADLINGLGSHQAITLGTVKDDPGNGTIWGVMADADLVHGKISRTQKFFAHQTGQGIMLVDYDQKGMTDAVRGRLNGTDPRDVILQAVGDVPHVHRLSTSAGLSNGTTGEEYSDSGGFHLYLPVAQADDIPRALKVLHKRMWLAGYGWHMVGSRGQLLERSLVDASVGGPERLIFEGPPVVQAPLVQDQAARQASVVGVSLPGIVLDTQRTLPDLTPEEEAQYTDLLRLSRDSMADQAQGVRDKFVTDEAQRTGRPVDDVRRDVELADKGRLPLDHVLYFDDPEIGAVTVRDVVTDLAEYEGKTLGDPVDPGDGRGKAKVLAGTMGVINSFAHGGGRFQMDLTPDVIGAAFMAAGGSEFGVKPDQAPVRPGIPCLNPTPEQRSDMYLEVSSCVVTDAHVIANAAIYKKAGDERYQMLEDRARESGDLTDFKRKVKQSIRREKMERLERTESRNWYNVSDPNRYLEIAEELERRAGEANMAFVFGGNPVVMKTQESSFGRITKRDATGQKIVDADGHPVTEPAFSTSAKVMKSPDFRRVAGKLGYFYGIDTEGQKYPTDAPGSLIQHLDAVAGDTLRPMTGIVQHPVMWRGKLLFGDGAFHPESGLYLQTGSLEVTQWDDPKAAYKFLAEEWLGDFAFETPLDCAKAVMLPASLLVTKTDLMHQPGPPIFLETAPFAGSGKTLRVSVAHAAITGSPAATVIYPDRPEERDKLFTTAIMGGATHIAFDNLRSGSTLGNSHKELATICTSPVHEGRILGYSKTFVGPAGVLVSGTGNNLILSGDMISRSVEIRHKPDPTTNLALRRFKHADLMGWTIENRSHIIGALACILSRPATNEAPGRFPAWSRIVAEPIIAASGVQGFYDEWIEAGEVDLHHGLSPTFGDLIEYLYPKMGGEWCSVGKVTALINADPQIVIKVFEQATSVDERTVGAYLRRNRDLAHGDRRLHAQKMNLGDETGRKKRWCFGIV